jgi:hypothetical protein
VVGVLLFGELVGELVQTRLLVESLRERLQFIKRLMRPGILRGGGSVTLWELVLFAVFVSFASLA